MKLCKTIDTLSDVYCLFLPKTSPGQELFSREQTNNNKEITDMVHKNIGDNSQLTIREFGEILCEEVRILMGSEYEVDYKEVLKNNGVNYHALLIRQKGRSIAPTIYFDSFYEAYRNGGLMVEIARDVVKTYHYYMPSEDQDMEFFEDFSNIAENLFFKVVNLKKNRKKLEGVPYRKFMDLALVPLCRVRSELLGEGIITIQKSFLEDWEITEDELWENIRENAAKAAPPKISGLMDIIENVTGTGAGTGSEDYCGIYVVSNDAGNLGASAAFYPGLLRSLSEDFESDLFIVPSSIHEVLVIPDSGLMMDTSNLKEIIHEVNSTTVAQEDILSDNLYRYDYESDRVFMVKDA